jgi:predicted Zn-dependent protease
LLKKIIEQLKKKGVDAWQIREARKTSLQSYLALSEREAIRRSETIKYRVSLHLKKSGDKPSLGLSGFTIGEGQTDLIEPMIDDALQAARLTSNEPFSLPHPYGAYPNVVLSDMSWQPKMLDECEERLKKAVARESGIRLSAAEFFLDRIHSRLLNSHGLEAEQEETMLYSEFILLAGDAHRGEKEFITRLTRRTMADMDLEREIASSARQAREATQATLPKTGRFPVVFSEEPLDNIFNPMIARTSGRLRYTRMLEVEKGKLVTEKEPTGDPLTLWSDAMMPELMGSYQFDGYGTPAQRLCLIEKNRVKNLLADHRYAEYLKTPVTGELGNIVVEPGTLSFPDLVSPQTHAAPVLYQITAFSAFEPNAITGAFSAEIRSGYEITSQGRTPIKGGSVSGILQRDLVGARFSKETERRERSLVPRGIFFPGLDIAGA